MLSFFNPLLLFGLVLIAIPLLIHLLSKTRYKIEHWGAMMFLKSALEVRSRRIKLEELIVLLLRILFITLLALALARPILNKDGGSLDDPTTHVLIIDNSYSMRQGENAPFERIKNTALSLIENMKHEDNMMIILGGSKAEALFPDPSFDKKYLHARVTELKPGIEQIFDLPKVIMETYWLLESSPLPRRRIYVLTDGQKEGWNAAENSRWANLKRYSETLRIKPSIYVVDESEDAEYRNLAIETVRPQSPIVDVYRPSKFFVEIGNYTDQDDIIHVEFYVDGILRGERDVECAPGKTITEFDHSFEAGTAVQRSEEGNHSYHYVTAKIEDDDLEVDNEYSLALEVKHTMRILIVEGSETEDIWASDGALLEYALSSTGEPGQEALFTVTRKNIYELEGGGFDNLEKYKTTILVNVPSLSRGFQLALSSYVEEGGGLLMVLGDKVNKEAYNKLSNNGKGLVPAKLIEIEECGKVAFRPSFPAGSASQVLDIFDVSRSRILDDVKVKKFWITEPSADSMNLGFLGDDPFLLYRHYGEGRVALLTTTANIRWTNFPVTQDYLPLFQNLVTYLSAGIKPPINLEQGEILVYPVGKDGSAKETCQIALPEGKIKELDVTFQSGKWTAEWADTEMPGIYMISSSNSLPKYYAVAFRGSEGDLSLLSGGDKKSLEKAVITDFVKTGTELNAAFKNESGVREWWRKLVALACLILCLELYLGWRFSS